MEDCKIVLEALHEGLDSILVDVERAEYDLNKLDGPESKLNPFEMGISVGYARLNLMATKEKINSFLDKIRVLNE